MAECKWCKDEFCVNGDCPMRADYCPVPNDPDVCKWEEREVRERMTDNEIVKALECCLQEYGNCDDCPYKEYQCVSEKDGNVFYKDILDLINRQKAEIENLNIELQAMRGAANSYKAEVERLKTRNDELNALNKTASTEAINTFAEKLKEYFPSIADAIDYTAKEMLS